MIHIGEFIRKVAEEKGIKTGDFAKKINKNRNNIYDIFKRSSVDSELLLKISKVLEHDFFIYYSESLRNLTDQSEAGKDRNAIAKELQTLHQKVDAIMETLKRKK